jgi:WS/DGAT/MGAT family acyltransferase
MVSMALATRDSDSPSPTLPFTAPHTPFNGALTPHRAVAYGGCQLEDMKRIKNVLGGTINDVVLAASAGTLRDWLIDHDGLPDQPLVVSCPVSIGGGSTEGPAEANRVSSMFVALPVEVDDPVKRYELIKENTKGAKELHGALGAETIMQLAESAPPALANQAARLYSSSKLADRHRPVQNLVVSNVPGPPIPLYCAGGRVEATYPMGPLIEGSGLNFTVLSNMGNLDFGVMACPELVPDVQDLADGFGRQVEILLKAADAAEAHTPSKAAATRAPRKRAAKKS